MTVAFAGDAAVKADLLDRVRTHAAAGTLRFGAMAWDGQGGSPLGVSTEGGDVADYSERFGYPLALAGALDPVTAYAARERAVDVALRWVECVPVGVDLSPIVLRIVGEFLNRLGADRLATPYRSELHALYHQESADTPPPRQAWAQLRERIEQAAATEAPHSDARAALGACATACWPLTTSSSIVPTLIAYWVNDANRAPDPLSDPAEQARAETMLHDIFTETQPLRDAGEHVDIPALLRARAPALAAAFEANLARANARYLDRARAVPDIVLAHLAATTP